MHCAICDKDDDSVTPFNSDCSECQEIIHETLAGYDIEELDEEPDVEVENVSRR